MSTHCNCTKCQGVDLTPPWCEECLDTEQIPCLCTTQDEPPAECPLCDGTKKLDCQLCPECHKCGKKASEHPDGPCCKRRGAWPVA